MLALFTLLFLLILGGFANGIISSTTMASKRYQIAKSNYEYVKDYTSGDLFYGERKVLRPKD